MCWPCLPDKAEVKAATVSSRLMLLGSHEHIDRCLDISAHGVHSHDYSRPAASNWSSRSRWSGNSWDSNTSTSTCGPSGPSTIAGKPSSAPSQRRQAAHAHSRATTAPLESRAGGGWDGQGQGCRRSPAGAAGPGSRPLPGRPHRLSREEPFHSRRQPARGYHRPSATIKPWMNSRCVGHLVVRLCFGSHSE
jgi:hypothetical protein